jgi:hypothetical protein
MFFLSVASNDPSHPGRGKTPLYQNLSPYYLESPRWVLMVMEWSRTGVSKFSGNDLMKQVQPLFLDGFSEGRGFHGLRKNQALRPDTKRIFGTGSNQFAPSGVWNMPGSIC